MTVENKIIVGISVGDINGIGIEVILKTFQDKRMLEFCTPVLFASSKLISYHRKVLGLDVPVQTIHSLDKIIHGKINVLNCWKEEIPLNLGELTPEGGKYALKSLVEATKSLKNRTIDILVTAPINKENIQSSEFDFPGHTEYLEQHFDGESLMILMTESLRVGLITGHVPVSEIAHKITPELIEKKVSIMYNSLVQDFRIIKPKIAVLGLNPHCGDNGVIGKEDEEIIRPTIQKIRDTGKLVFGPYASDGFFGSKTYTQFDGVLAMYHDQGLAPFKTLAFGGGVNFTAGLNKIRTSPDHGTGFDIAGKNKATHDSFKEALFSGISIFRNRKEYLELQENKM